jgi:tetratricopeptide (TPR) repeat protein
MDKQKEPFLKELPYTYTVFSDFIEKLIAKKNTLYTAIGCVVTLSIFLVYVFSRMQHNTLKNVSLAESYVEELSASPRNDKADDLFLKLWQLAKKEPLIAKRYAAVLAQELLLRGKLQEAKPYIHESIRLLQNSHLEQYAQFSELAVLSSSGKFKEALEKAELLKKSLHKKQSSPFYLFVLFQKSAIEEALDLKDKALKTKEELSELLKKNPALSHHFQTQELSTPQPNEQETE